MKFFAADMPNFIKKELEQLQDVLHPFLKKVSKYTLWSIPLIGVSIINLFILFVFVSGETRSTLVVVLTAALGAFGFALSKEARFQQKEIQKRSVDYMIDRIKNSKIVSDLSKDKYASLLKKQPLDALNYFIKFLEEENRVKRV